jgi:DNA-binding PadR family transcriptional regulator
MLTEGPASGYDLKKEFESTFSHFFAAGYGSIYPALSSLSDSGYVDCEEIPQEGKPDRKVYRITAEGHRFLCEALKNLEPCHKIRSEFLATMCFAHLMPADDVQAILDHRLASIEQFQRMFDQFEQDSVHEWPEGAKFVLVMGRAIATAMATYINENRQTLAANPAARSAAG